MQSHTNLDRDEMNRLADKYGWPNPRVNTWDKRSTPFEREGDRLMDRYLMAFEQGDMDAWDTIGDELEAYHTVKHELIKQLSDRREATA